MPSCPLRAPGLRSRNDVGGVGSANRPAALSPLDGAGARLRTLRPVKVAGALAREQICLPPGLGLTPNVSLPSARLGTSFTHSLMFLVQVSVTHRAMKMPHNSHQQPYYWKVTVDVPSRCSTSSKNSGDGAIPTSENPDMLAVKLGCK